MLESLNYNFGNPKNIIWVIYRIKQLRNYKKNHGVLGGPKFGKQRWQVRLGILRVKLQIPVQISKTHRLWLTQIMILQNWLEDFRFGASKWEHFNVTWSTYSTKGNCTHLHEISVGYEWYFLRKAMMYRHVAPTATAFAVLK